MNEELLDQSWAEMEFATADLGDSRRTARLVQLASQLAQQPSASLPLALSDAAALKATYRFFANAAFDSQDIIASHLCATYRRCADVALVLAVQDTTELNYSAHPATSGLGPLRTDQQQRLLLHTTIALSSEGLPLGLLGQHQIVRQALGQRATHHQRPIEHKESYKWLVGLHSINYAAAQAAATNFICVADREADIYDLFVAPRAANVYWLIRANEPRKLLTSTDLFAQVRDLPAVGQTSVLVQGKAGQPDRVADLQVKCGQVTLLAPVRYKGAGSRQLEVTVVVSEEREPPHGENALLWVLLTNWPLEDADAALQVVGWYAQRWGIELWHKTLKSGCRVEARQLRDGEALQRMAGVYSIVAWRIQYGVMLARAAPQLSCEVWLSRNEWQALCCTIQNSKQPPAQAPRLGEAVVWIAKLGGYLGRKGDGSPGAKTLWQGLQRLADLTIMYNIMRSLPRSG